MKIEFDDYSVALRTLTPILGGAPKDAYLYTRFIASKAPTPEIGEEEAQELGENGGETGMTGFHQDDKGVFIYDYHILGFLKEAGNTLKKQAGIKNLRSKIDQFVFVLPRKIYIAKDIDDVLERPLRASTLQGPRVTLVSSELVKEGVEIRFQLRVIKNDEKVTGDLLRSILDYGQFRGLGQWRNGGYGRFEVIEFEPIQVKEEKAAS